MTIQNLSSNFLSAVDTKSFMEYGTKIQKAQDSKENTEESIFKLQNVSYTSQNTSSSKSEDLTKDNNEVSTPDTSKTLSLLQSLVQSLTSLINQLTGKQEDLYDDNLEAVKSNKTKESDETKKEDEIVHNSDQDAKVNSQETQKEDDGVAKISSRAELLQAVEQDGYQSKFLQLRSSDLQDIFAYDVQYKDGQILCTDANGVVKKIYTIGKEGLYAYDRLGDSNRFRSGGRISESLGYGKYYESQIPPEIKNGGGYCNDLTFRYIELDDRYAEILRKKGFEFTA